MQSSENPGKETSTTYLKRSCSITRFVPEGAGRRSRKGWSMELTGVEMLHEEARALVDEH